LIAFAFLTAGADPCRDALVGNHRIPLPESLPFLWRSITPLILLAESILCWMAAAPTLVGITGTGWVENGSSMSLLLLSWLLMEPPPARNK